MAIVWNNWVQQAGTTTASSTTTDIWYVWVSNNTATTTTIQDTVWGTWQNMPATSGSQYYFPQRYVAVDPYANETEEERAARLEREEQQRALYTRKARRVRIRKEIAAIRAKRLLHSLMTAEQIEEYERTKSFHVQVRDPRARRFRSFRVNHGVQGNVTELDEHGRPRTKYCIHPSGVPTEDTMAAQLLMLQTDIEEFERIANRSRAYA